MTTATFSPSTVAAIVKAWGSGSDDILTKSGKVDKRKASGADIREAWIHGLCDQSGVIQHGSSVFPHQLPASVLWELLKSAIAESSGFSLASHPVWRDLGLWEITKKPYFQDWMLQEMERCLVVLDLAGKIKFLSAGTVWDISVKPE